MSPTTAFPFLSFIIVISSSEVSRSLLVLRQLCLLNARYLFTYAGVLRTVCEKEQSKRILAQDPSIRSFCNSSLSTHFNRATKNDNNGRIRGDPSHFQIQQNYRETQQVVEQDAAKVAKVARWIEHSNSQKPFYDRR